ncbi:ABC transporter substrate-binding protein [Devosia pacifica]|uniref:ABC transporter substrate-binding protein n=1 Tax=Devosia pacifica TaxID=1335967 RepID=A0A918S4R8_9HYPH|nr:extracellular solute-binding protein [Devosia pacifica]GHA21318.1 ABC transporter substrate-binding protein [Devosia pacifica]
MIHNFGRLARHRNAIALSLAALLAGASASAAQTTINWLHLEANPERLATWEEIAAAYEAENPDVNIEFQFLENEAFKAKLPTLLQSNEAPDMFYTWGGGVLEAQSQTGAIRDITAAMDENDGEWRSSISPAAVDGLTIDGKVWAAPIQSGVVSFFYNKELFEEAGVDGESIETWDDFLAAVQALKDAGITPIAGGGGEKWPIHFYWSYLAMRELGQEGFNTAKNGEGFMGEGFVAASENLIELGELDPFQEGWLGATWPETQAVFADGRAAIILSFENTATPQNQANAATDGEGLAQDNIGRFPFPVVEGGEGQITDDFGGLNGWVVTTNAPPETEDFLKYFTNVENTRLLAERNNVLPTTIGAQEGVADPTMAMAAEQMSKATWHQNYLDQDLGPNVGRVVNDMSVELVDGQMTPQEALQQIQDAFSMEMM